VFQTKVRIFLVQGTNKIPHKKNLFFFVEIFLFDMQAEKNDKEISVFDGERMASICCQSAKMQRRLIAMYLDDLKSGVEKLKNSVGSKEEALHCSHDLKGSSLNVGAEAIGHLCQTLERAVRADEMDSFAHIVDSLPALAERTEAAMSAYGAQLDQDSDSDSDSESESSFSDDESD
jgi:HPt (histidine-containing phosphotransfer) domain-containing protein